MSSREFDGILDDLFRQALYPFAEAEPPVRVWRRVLRAVRLLSPECEASIVHRVFAGLLVPAGLPATFSRCLGFLSGLRASNVTYVPLFSSRVYCVDRSGRCPTASFWDITWTQMFDLRLAS
ncbi:MAG: hypothetical protein JXR84_02370 [Anaerolineae bacterium]|nr:hypothetical protein [Anaerolineae bacterium]